MSIRILGGELKGLPLFVPTNSKTRPTSVMLKRRVFDSFQDLENILFIDICAGTGSVGFEALSRGAREVTFVESLPAAYNILVKNQKLIEQKIDCLGKVNIERKTVEKWLPFYYKKYEQLPLEMRSNVIIFFDPPYENHQLYEYLLSYFLKQNEFIGMLWVEADEKKGPSVNFWKGYKIF